MKLTDHLVSMIRSLQVCLWPDHKRQYLSVLQVSCHWYSERWFCTSSGWLHFE